MLDKACINGVACWMPHQPLQAIDEFLSLSKSVAKDEPVLLEGEWQMIWSSQVLL